MKYTKKQRHEIYKKALINHRYGGFMCQSIWESATGTPFNFIGNVNRNRFPEFFLFEPDWAFLSWFTFYSNKKTFEHQKTILEFCIEMTR